MKTVLLIGTLDTKGPEYAFVRELILARGHAVLVMDLGVLGEPPFAPDVSAAAVARAGGAELATLRSRNDRGRAVDAMLAGARALVRRMHDERRFDGVLGLGGGGGTAMITAAMRELPVGVPKVVVSTMASGNTTPYVDVKDVTMMYSVVDIAGLKTHLSEHVRPVERGARWEVTERNRPAACPSPRGAGNRGGG